MEINVLQITHFINGENITLFPTIVRQDGKNYLIDCGYKETFENFVLELKRLNLTLNQIEGVIISHDDIDHIGGLENFKEFHPDIKVYCGSLEELSVSGKIKSERLVQAENSLEMLTGEYRTWALAFIESLINIKRFEVDRSFNDGDFIEKDLAVIHTPGHTRGHISLYVPSQKTLIANDALVIENGQFDIANPSYTLDIKAAVQSIEKIKMLPLDKVICYHGGIMDGDIEAKLDQLIGRYK